MRLSLKFFSIAYTIILLSTGLGGMLFVGNVNSILWKNQVERVHSAVNYAADSFLAFADASYGKALESQKDDIIRQIKSSTSDVVSNMQIYTEKSVKDEYAKLEENSIVSKFIKKDGLLAMKSVCKLNTGNNSYYLVFHSDFSDIQKQCDLIWNSCAILVLSISMISGLLLFIATKKVTKPLRLLAKVTDEIAFGNYGKKVDIHTSDYEIKNLSESFNSMSMAVEQKIKEISEEAEKRDTFVANFTHELKTPMTAIIGYSQMLDCYELDEIERKEAAITIYNEAKRLEKLSMQLLDLYVYQHEEIEIETLNLLAIEMQLKASLKYLSEKYHVGVTVNLHNEIVFANQVLVLSLIYNLADNAFKASKPETMVKIYSKSEDGLVRIFVADKGRGIAKGNQRFLTEPFYREEKSRSRKFGGAGLGLSLCKEIALLHGTELCFESEKGEGTTVSFTLRKGGEDGEET